MNDSYSKKAVYLIIILTVIFGFYFILNNKKGADMFAGDLNEQDQNNSTMPSATPQISNIAESGFAADAKKSIIIEPVVDALARITKKPFGIKVSPAASPVTPEKFSGYHTGVDFETSDLEQNTDVPVYAICAGLLLFKAHVSGYGGVAVQRCQINNEIVTVVYGHLRLASVEAVQGTALSVGQKIGILGKGYSAETDGERKHLHLGIHKGSVINIRGYVAKQSELEAWIDGGKYLFLSLHLSLSHPVFAFLAPTASSPISLSRSSLSLQLNGDKLSQWQASPLTGNYNPQINVVSFTLTSGRFWHVRHTLPSL